MVAGVRHPTTEDDQVRVECVEDVRDARGEHLDRFVPDARRQRVACGRRLGDVAGGQLLETGKTRRLAGCERLARADGDVRTRRMRLETAAPAASASPAVVVDRQVAKLAGIPGDAAVRTSVEDQTAADPGRDREVDQVLDVARPAGAVPPLGDRGGRGVVVDGDRTVERVADDLRERDLVPAG